MAKNLVNLKQIILSPIALKKIEDAIGALGNVREFLGLVNGSGEVIISANLLSSGFLEVIMRMETEECTIILEKEIPLEHWCYRGSGKEPKK
jgi:hypothetical protein